MDVAATRAHHQRVKARSLRDQAIAGEEVSVQNIGSDPPHQTPHRGIAAK